MLLSKLLLACLHDDTPNIIALQRESGMVTTHMDPWVLEKYARISWDNDGREVTEGLNIQLFIERLDARDKIIKTNDEFIMPSRMCMMLNGLGYALRYQSRTCVMLQEKAREVLQAEDPLWLAQYPRLQSQ